MNAKTKQAPKKLAWNLTIQKNKNNETNYTNYKNSW